MATKDSEFIVKQCRYFHTMASEIKDDEKRFNFVRTHILSLDECMQDGAEKTKLLKSIVTWAVKKIATLDNFKSDLRMLDLWRLLGKYSEEMKMEGVLENVHRLGYFKTCQEFYLIWAQHWAVQNNRKNFDKIVQLCTENCGYDCKEIFRPLLEKYFEGYASDSSVDTMALIKMIAVKPDDIRRDLTLFNDCGTKPTSSNANTVKQHHAEHAKQLQQQQQDQSVVINPEEFSVFRDPTINIDCQPVIQALEKLPQSHQNQIQQEEDEPMCQQIQQQLETNTAISKSPIIHVPEVKTTTVVKDNERISTMLCSDFDITLSGSHGKFASTVFTSTPRRSVAPENFEPIFEISQNQFMEDFMMTGTSNDAGVFANRNKEIPAGGSKLQRFLTKTNEQANKDKSKTPNNNVIAEIVDRIKRSSIVGVNENMKTLKIASTIEEVEEEKENTSTFASPSRKKKKESNMKSDGQSFVPTTAQQHEPTIFETATEFEFVQKVDDEANGEQLNTTTHLGKTSPKIKPGTANPWDENKRQQILLCAPFMIECHENKFERCPRVEISKTVILDNEKFLVEKLLGQGGFARVYKIKSLDTSQTYALKYEAPACPWEVYICAMLRRRLPQELIKSVMQVKDAHVFSNASAIVYEFNQHGTLLDLSNLYKKNSTEMSGLLVTYFGIQLGHIIEQVHAANIIHADMKPDNVMLTIGALDEKMTIEQLLQIPALKLIDWGRSIDMKHFKNQEFVGRAGTEQFDCVEMICGLPWTFQTDFYGFVATIYVLMKGEYLVTFKREGKIIPAKCLKRRMSLYDLWTEIFDQFLNIPSCKELPNWSHANQKMVDRLKIAVSQERKEWKKALEQFNGYVKQQTNDVNK